MPKFPPGRSGFGPTKPFVVARHPPVGPPSATGAVTPDVFIRIDGVERGVGRLNPTEGVHIAGLAIDERLGDSPSTCTFVAHGFQPTVGMDVVIRFGWVDNPDRLFGGVIIAVEQLEAGKLANPLFSVSCSSYLSLLNRRKVTKRYVNQSATDIAYDLVANYAPGFGVNGIANPLPTVDEISYTFEDLATALSRLAQRIGGYFSVDYFKNVRLFLTETGTNPVDITVAHPSAIDLRFDYNLAQIVTRVYSEGMGAAVDIGANNTVAPGSTKIPLTTQVPFSAGTVRSSTQVISYSGVSADANLATTTNGIAQNPGAPTATKTSNAGGLQGTVAYKVSFIKSDGESELGTASSNVAATSVTAPNSNATFTGFSSGGNLVAAAYVYGMSHITAYGETEVGDIGAPTYGGGTVRGELTNIPTSGDARVIARRLWRSKGGHSGTVSGNDVFLLGTLSDNTGTTFSDIYADSSLGIAAPRTNTTGDTGTLTSIPTGPAGTTGRNIWRTKAGGSSYFLCATLNDNTATTLTDVKLDSQLGIAAPAASKWPTAAGSTTLPLVSRGSQAETSGFMKVGTQVVSFAGVSGSTLTGIPASGVGAIVADVPAGTSVICVPFLKGVTGIIRALNNGDEVNVFVQVDDLPAQATLKAMLQGVLGVASDGVQEEYMQDGRVSLTEATARANAFLTLRKNVVISVAYRCRDILTRVGRTVTVNIPPQANYLPVGMTGTFKIQSVTLTGFGVPNTYPVYTVKASSIVFSFEDLLRRMQSKLNAAP